jgi:hypothetical protein
MSWARLATNLPICWGLDARIIMATRIGTTVTPLISALQTSALIGSSGERSTPMPSRIPADAGANGLDGDHHWPGQHHGPKQAEAV